MTRHRTPHAHRKRTGAHVHCAEPEAHPPPLQGNTLWRSDDSGYCWKLDSAQAIRIIADHGRGFFYNQAANRYASMEGDARGKVWFIDDYSGWRIFTHDTVRCGRWRGFSHGGTLKDLVKEFRDYICTGKQLHPGYLGPARLNDSNIWGYYEEGMQAERKQAGALPVFHQPVS